VTNVGRLVDYVDEIRAEECLARVICELSRDGRVHGENGSKFAKCLLKFRQSKHPKVKQYVHAESLGTRIRNYEQCKIHYHRCNYSTTDIITVGNKLLSIE